MGKRKTVDILPEANGRRLLDKLHAFRPYVLHFIGHACPERSRRSGLPGASDAPDDLPAPSLVLEGSHTATQRRPDYLTADELHNLYRSYGVRIVVLNCFYTLLEGIHCRQRRKKPCPNLKVAVCLSLLLFALRFGELKEMNRCPICR